MKPLNINAEKYVRRLIRESLNRYENKVYEGLDNQNSEDSMPNNQGTDNSGNNREFQRDEKEKELMNSIRDLISQYFEGYGPMQSDTELMEGK